MIRWFPEFHGHLTNPHIEYSQEYNIYYAGYGPMNTMSKREHPSVGGANPLYVYDFSQLDFTFGDARETEEVWDLAGNRYEVTVAPHPVDGEPALFHEGNPLQEKGVIDGDHERGTQPDLGIPDGKIKIGAYFYDFSNGIPVTVLRRDIHDGDYYRVYTTPYCTKEVNLVASIPGSSWSLRPLTCLPLHPLGVAAYSDSHWNSWLFPIPFPDMTFTNDKLVVKDNGYIMVEWLPRIQYDRSTYCWSGMFPLAHSINSPMQRGFIRNKPMIVKLRKRYRMHCEYL